MDPIRPKANSLTEEAQQALANQGQDPETFPSVDTGDSAEAADEQSTEDPWADEEWHWAEAENIDPVDAIEAELIDEAEPVEETKPVKTKAKSGPPNLDDWEDFFSRVVLRVVTDWYVSFAFRGVDEELLSEREVARLKLKPQERQAISRPFAELANKAKFTRKHGRMIIATADSFDSVLALGMWFSRVNRIASKYRPQRSNKNERSRQNAPANGQAANAGQQGFRVYSPGSG